MNAEFNAQTIVIAVVSSFLGPAFVALLNHHLQLRRSGGGAPFPSSTRWTESAARWSLVLYVSFAIYRLLRPLLALGMPADTWLVLTYPTAIACLLIVAGTTVLRKRRRLALFLIVPALLYQVAINARFLWVSFWPFGVHVILCAICFVLLFRASYAKPPCKV